MMQRFFAKFPIVLIVSFASATPAIAGAIAISCEIENSMAASGGPLTLSYEGAESGTLKLRSKRINIEMPATKEVRKGTLDGKPHTVTGIRGAIESVTAMPSQQALEDCVAKNTSPEFKDDADIASVTLLTCMKTVPHAATPVKAATSVSIALVPSDEARGADDVVVEIKRTYLEKSSVPGGTISLETYPGRCTLRQ